jgi:hypothetical protein
VNPLQHAQESGKLIAGETRGRCDDAYHKLHMDRTGRAGENEERLWFHQDLLVIEHKNGRTVVWMARVA